MGHVDPFSIVQILDGRILDRMISIHYGQLNFQPNEIKGLLPKNGENEIKGIPGP